MYNEYQQILERHIEKLVQESGTTVDQFFRALKQDYESDGESAIYVEMILAVADFSNFIEMMQSYKRNHPSQ